MKNTALLPLLTCDVISISYTLKFFDENANTLVNYTLDVNGDNILNINFNSKACTTSTIGVGYVIPDVCDVEFIMRSKSNYSIIRNSIGFDLYAEINGVAYELQRFYYDNVVRDEDKVVFISAYDALSKARQKADFIEDVRLRTLRWRVNNELIPDIVNDYDMAYFNGGFQIVGSFANGLANYRTKIVPYYNKQNDKQYMSSLAKSMASNVMASFSGGQVTAKFVSFERPDDLSTITEITLENPSQWLRAKKLFKFKRVKFRNRKKIDGKRYSFFQTGNTGTKLTYKWGMSPFLDAKCMTNENLTYARQLIANALSQEFVCFSITGLPALPIFEPGDWIKVYDSDTEDYTYLCVTEISINNDIMTLSCGDVNTGTIYSGGNSDTSNTVVRASASAVSTSVDNQFDEIQDQVDADVVKYSNETEHEYNGSLAEASGYGAKIDNLILDHKLEVAGIKQISNAMYGIDNGDGTFTHYAKMYLIDLFPIIPAGSGAGSSDGISFGSTFVGHEVLDYVDDHGNVHKKSSGKRGLWTIVHSGYCAEVIVKIVSPFKCVVCMTNGAWTDDSYQSPAYSRMDTTITDNDDLSYYNTYSISSYAWSDDALSEVETYTDYDDWEPNPKPEYASGKCFAFMGLELVDGEIIAHRMSWARGSVGVISTGTSGTYSIDLLADSNGYYGTVKDILSGGETYKIKATDGINCMGNWREEPNCNSFTFETIADIWSYEYIDTYTRGMRKYNAGHTFPSSTNYYNKMALSAMEPVRKYGSSSTLSRPNVEMLRSNLASEQACYVPMFYCNYTAETISADSTYAVAAVEGYESEFVELFNYVSEIAITRSITPNTIDATFAHALIGGGGNTATPLNDFTAYLDILGNENTVTGLQNGTHIVGSNNSLAYDSDSLYDGDIIIVGNDNVGMVGSGSGVFIGNAGNGLYIQNIDGNTSQRDVIIYKGYQEVGRVITDSTYSVALSSDTTNLYLIQEIDGTQEVVSTIPWTAASGVFYTKTEIDALLDAKADISDIPTALSAFTDDLGDNPVHTHSQYLTEHQSLSNYYTKGQTDDLLDDKADASTTYSKTEVDNLLTAHDYSEGTNIDITSRVISLDIPIVEDDSSVPNGAYFAEFDENASNGEWASAQDVQALNTSVNSLTITVNQKADIDDVYTRAQIADLLSEKADVDDIPTVPTALSAFTDDLGANPVHTHSQYLTEHQSLSGYYTKTQTDTLLDAKADSSDVYTKTQADTLLNAKANANSVYTITQTDENFNKKPLYIIPQYDSTTETYSITETNGEIKQALAEGRKVLLLTRYSTAVDSDGHYRYYPLSVEQYRYTPTASLSALRAYYYEFELDTNTNSVIKTNYYLRVFNNDDEDVPTITVTTETVTDTNTQEVYVIEADTSGSTITFSDTFDNVHGFMENGYTVVLDDGSMMYTLQEYTNSYMLFVATVYNEVYSIAWTGSSGGRWNRTTLQPEIEVYNRSTVDEDDISNSTVYMVLEDN